MTTFTFGPLRVEVEGLGKLNPPWSEYEEKWASHLTIKDSHGHSFEAGWFSDSFEPKVVAARLVGLLWTAVNERDFPEEFSGGYRGKERSWRSREAYRLREAGKTFIPEELTKAAAVAYRQSEYEQTKGPRDWSPRGEFPIERLPSEPEHE